MNLETMYIQTYTGKKFYFLNPDIDAIDIRDIAKALGKTCRFGGMCDPFYSVAEHLYHISYMVPNHHIKEAFMHDASEAYVGDIPKPLKRILAPLIDPIEDHILEVVYAKYGISYPLPPSVKLADLQMLYWERHEVMGPSEDEWEDLKGLDPPISMKPDIQGWSHQEASAKFLDRFYELFPQ